MLTQYLTMVYPGICGCRLWVSGLWVQSTAQGHKSRHRTDSDSGPECARTCGGSEGVVFWYEFDGWLWFSY